MTRKQAEAIAARYLKPVYGFALKRCANPQDAEDLAQEIIFKVYRALLTHGDIESIDKFIWTAAHNAMSNYYRGKSRYMMGICTDEEAILALPSDEDVSDAVIERETAKRLHMEIAYLSKLQRRIVIAYYYENKKQEAIARELQIPLGTVKWHLFEAKKELKKGMETMRNLDELKFNPIKFDFCGTSGSVGTKGNNGNFFRTALSQNIEYAVWKNARSAKEIAEILGVSPVYVESEAEYLYEYGFLTKQGGKYLCNILLDEPTDELVRIHDEMYTKAAKLYANALYDAIDSDGILDSGDIFGGAAYGTPSLVQDNPLNKNFILWALIPYIAAWSGERLMDNSISFEEACTLRPDGGQNICQASVSNPQVKQPMYYDSMKCWYGPCWNANEDFTLWQIDSEWSGWRIGDNYPNEAGRILSMLPRLRDGKLTPEEYAYLAEKGIVKIAGEPDGIFKVELQAVWIRDIESKNKLIAIGDRIKEKLHTQFRELKMPFVKAVLSQTPNQLQIMQKFVLQFLFSSDGWFILHCLKELVENGKLKIPSEEQKKSLSVVILPSR